MMFQPNYASPSVFQYNRLLRSRGLVATSGRVLRSAGVT
jgi:hypothetical protein